MPLLASVPLAPLDAASPSRLSPHPSYPAACATFLYASSLDASRYA